MELPQLGNHCEVCKRNDYIFFKCAYCNKLVCIEHKESHPDCPINQLSFEPSALHELSSERQEIESLKDACEFCKCLVLRVELVKCEHCSSSFCLSHRHRHLHKCPSLDADEAKRRLRAEEASEKSRKALDQLRQHLKQKTSEPAQALPATSQSNSKLARKVRLMKLKMNSRGVAGTPEEDRIYLLCKYSHNATSRRSRASDEGRCVSFFASPEQSVGRLVDWIADELGLGSALYSDERLVFRKLAGNGPSLTLDSNAPFKAYLTSGALESGDEVLATFEVRE